MKVIIISICAECPFCKLHEIYDNDLNVYVCEKQWDELKNINDSIDKYCPLEDLD